MEAVFEWLAQTIGAMGYPGIFLLMAMESSVIPVPSELVMPPAGYLASKGEMSILIAILCGTIGSLLGSYCMYFAAQYLGRPLIIRYGRYVGISDEKLTKVELYFATHGEISIFIARLLPVVRHLISLPAGLSKMNHARFSAYTLLGAGLWVTVLTYIGYYIGENRELVAEYSHRALVYVIIGAVVLVAVYIKFFAHRHRAETVVSMTDD